MYNNKSVLALIPARMGSSRFPGKPMAKIHGVPMIEIVHRNVLACPFLDDVYVATCDEVILEHIISQNGNSVLTSSIHQRASDRCAEALTIIEERNKTKYDIVVMVQGDEPMVTAPMIEQSVAPLVANPSISAVNLLGPLSQPDHANPNCIKVVTDLSSRALYMTRAPIPSAITLNDDLNGIHFGKQVCVISFTRDSLLSFSELPVGILETSESIDMLRYLANGHSVHMAPTRFVSHPVDVPSDIDVVESILL